MPIKVTLDKWDVVRATILKAGIRNAEEFPDGASKTITANDGKRYEFPREIFDQVRTAGIPELGLRVRRAKASFVTFDSSVVSSDF
jgi:hypothetical protein